MLEDKKGEGIGEWGRQEANVFQSSINGLITCDPVFVIPTSTIATTSHELQMLVFVPKTTERL